MLIYGSGTMGLMMLELAKRTGAAERRRPRHQPGAAGHRQDASAAPGAAASAEELDRPRGWDVVIDATGNAAAIQDGLGPGRQGAARSCSSGSPTTRPAATIEPYRIYNQEITITGSMAVLHSYERAAELFATGVLDP